MGNKCTEVQHHGCRALRNLGVNNNNKVLITDEFGHRAIIHAMNEHLPSADAQHHGCKALRILAGNAHNEQLIYDAGGHKVVLEAMHEHRSNVDVQHFGCWALDSTHWSG